ALALTRQTADKRRTIELDLGVVGPASLARQTQILVHEILQTTIPRGWSNQLKTEPGIVLAYDDIRKYRLLSFGSDGVDAGAASSDALSLVAAPHVSASLGNIYTYAGAGGALLFGDIAADAFGPARIRPGVPGSDAIAGDLSGRGGFSWYLFAGADARYVARNIFLDGNTFTDSHSVDKKPVVVDLQVGATVTIRGARLTLMQVFRTREFEGQPESDRFGVVEVAFRF
ncbi:MAG: lipid A deacylase LpxR family protein, partial [Alphaproteobacteria bacterium]